MKRLNYLMNGVGSVIQGITDFVDDRIFWLVQLFE